MKMTSKQRERMTGVLEALKSGNYIKSYRIEGDDVNSVVTEWVEGQAERAFEELLHNVDAFGVKKSDRGWVACLLPNEWRERVTEALLARTKESALRLCRTVVEKGPAGANSGIEGGMGRGEGTRESGGRDNDGTVKQ